MLFFRVAVDGVQMGVRDRCRVWVRYEGEGANFWKCLGLGF